jgi:hypothetical protein
MSPFHEHETDHLAVDGDGRVWALGPPPERIGPVDCEPDWPARLGPEPAWYAGERDTLLDLWVDGLIFRAAIRAEQRRGS